MSHFPLAAFSVCTMIALIACSEQQTIEPDLEQTETSQAPSNTDLFAQETDSSLQHEADKLAGESDQRSSVWQPVTFTNEKLRTGGTLTGDGAQWVRALAIDPKEGTFMLWCTDVGGLFRSLDGGKNWEPTNIGFDSRGSAGVAIDPHNPHRAIVIAANSARDKRNGIYLTTDQAASWQQVESVVMAATRDQRRQVAYDPSSFDQEAGYTKVIYWSTLSEDGEHSIVEAGTSVSSPALYKSNDGGATWSKLSGGEVVADAHLAVHPSDGSIYAGTPEGLKVSRDGGLTWETTLPGKITGVSVSVAAPDSVWVTQADAVQISTDRGETFNKIPGSERLRQKDAQLEGITVAPSDPSRMMLWRNAPNWQWDRFYSHDGGATWNKSSLIKDRVILPSNTREGLFSFHPTNPDIILSPGGDYPALSYDGGATFALAGNGVNNLYVGSGFNFSLIDPNILYLASQDYATLLTKDGGANWQYLEPSGQGWGGFNYAAYSPDGKTLITGESKTWGNPSTLAVSTDGGVSWTLTEMEHPIYSTYGDPKDPTILFAARYRSGDGGKTWSEMSDVHFVGPHDLKTGALFGTRTENNKTTILTSSDSGLSWSDVYQHDGLIEDLAYDSINQYFYIISRGQLYRVDKAEGSSSRITGFVSDQAGAPHLRSVAVDPVNPDVLYIAANRNVFASNASAQRSLDGGQTWTNLTLNTPLDGIQKDGGREAQHVRVHPITREAWFTTGCYGVWKYLAPNQ